MEFPLNNGRAMARQGVCTGWLNDKTQGLQPEISSAGDSIDKDMSAMSLDDKCLQVCVECIISNQKFHFSSYHCMPCIRPTMAFHARSQFPAAPECKIVWLRVRKSYYRGKLNNF